MHVSINMTPDRNTIIRTADSKEQTILKAGMKITTLEIFTTGYFPDANRLSQY